MQVKKLSIALLILFAFAIGILAGRQLVKMGNTDSTQTPEDTQSYTLEDVYVRLDTGVVNAETAFTEPGVPPGTGTMHTIDQIMTLIPDHKDSFDGAEGAREIPIPDGIYKGDKTATAVDADLKAENILAGIEVFDVQGDRHGGCRCIGTLSGGGRWCDNGDGTVTDLTTCLVWLQTANLTDGKPWEDDTGSYDDVHTLVGRLEDSAPNSNLSDGSEKGEWRIPTQLELQTIFSGTEAVSRSNPRFFTNIVQDGIWRSATPVSSSPDETWVYWDNSGSFILVTLRRLFDTRVWPVRGPLTP